LVLAGGFGTRLWPLSRKDFPKQFIKVWSKRSTYQAAVKRAEAAAGSLDRVYVVTSEEYRFHALGQAREVGLELPEGNIIAEPLRRDTAPAIYYGMRRALELAGLDDAIVMVFPSDHLVKNEEGFPSAGDKAAIAAARGFISLVAVQPTKPEPGLGYMKAGDLLGDGIYRVEEFIEKPDRERVEEMLREGGWYWSTMIMAFRASAMEREFEKHLPEVYDPLNMGLKEELTIQEAYQRAKKVDVSSGLLSKCVDRLALVPAENLGWSDLGSFEALYELLSKDACRNAVDGKTRLLESEGNLVISERFVALVGVRDMMVIDSGDALLICPKGLGQMVKGLAKQLIDEGLPEATRHLTVYTDWGCQTTLLKSDDYEVKSLRIEPGKRIAPHRHFYRFEYWAVLRGSASVIIDGQEKVLTKGMGVLIAPGQVHELRNPGKVPLEMIEIATAEYLMDDDVEHPRPK